MVRGLGTATPSITSPMGHAFTQLRYEFPAAGTVAYAGRCEIDFARCRDATAVTVRGVAAYSLTVSTTGVAHGELASIGLVVLVAVPIRRARLVAGERV